MAEINKFDTGMADPVTLLHVPPRYTMLGDLPPGDIIFSVANGNEVLRIKGDGRLERGAAFSTDDEASMAFFDVLSKNLATWMSHLLQRAESAEAELAALKRTD